MISVEIEGLTMLNNFASRLEYLLSPESLTERVILVAREAGQLLHRAAVRACIEAVYDHPNFPSLWTSTPSHPDGYFTRDGKVYHIVGSDGNEATRTNALLDSHELVDEGMTQTVRIDPAAEAQVDTHPGRELVLDYAIPVHEGYTQFVYGYNTGVFHPGRFWFDVAAQESGPVIASFLEIAFEQIVAELLTEAAA